MKVKKNGARCRVVMLWAFLVCCAPFVSRAQTVNDVVIQMLSYDYNCSTGMATVKYHITNSDPSGYVGGYNTSYTINLGVYSISGFIGNGDDDVEFTGGYIIGDMIECKAYGVGNNFSYPTTFDYIGSLPRPAKPYIFPFGSSVTTCNGQPVTLYAHNASGNPATFIWSNGQTGESINVTAPGTYTVQEAGSCGNSDPSDAIVVVVNSAPAAPVISANGSTTLCSEQSVVLNTTPSSGGTIHWSTGETGNSITVSTAGSYYAYEVNDCGQSTNSNVITISSISNASAPVIGISTGQILCNGNPTTIRVISSGGGTIYWNTGQTGSSITVNTAGSYYVYESNACGNTGNSNEIEISTENTPGIPTIQTNQNTLLCDGATATLFVASPVGIVRWNTGEEGPSITKSAAGNYYAYQVNACGQSDNSSVITLSVASSPAAPTASPSGPVSLCNGSSTTLSASGSAPFTWYQDDVAVGTGNSISVNAAGTYTVRSSNSCGSSSNSNTVEINTLTNPAAPTVTPPGNQLLCNGQSATFSASGSNITWSNGVLGNSMTTAVAGTYYAYDRNACGNSGNSNSVVITTGNCPTPSPGTSFFICPGALKTLDAGGGYDSYQWSNGATTQTIAVGPGNYAVTVTKNGCSATSMMITVSYYTVTTPVINPSGPLVFCNGGSVTLAASVGTAYLWSTGATSNSITVSTPGSYYVTVTDANGCQATSVNTQVVVNPLPTASVSGTTSVCQNGADGATPTVLFTGNGATAPYTFFYTINGGSVQTVTTSSGNSVAVAVPTNVFGTFRYALVGVQESSSTTCYNSVSGSATVTVNELPTASIAGNTTVCQNGSNPLITFTGTGGVAPYTFSYTLNGGAVQTISTVSGNSVTITAPTNVVGNFVYELVSVRESSGTTCSNSASGNVTVIVRGLPTATIDGTTVVCQNSGSPLVRFTGSNGVAPYTFTYQLNGGANQTITTVSGNSIAVAVPTNIAGTFTYTLLSVSESGVSTCANTASGTADITVNPQPPAAVLASPSTHLCNWETGTLTVFNWVQGSIYSWYKDGVLFATATGQTIGVTQAGSYTVMVTSDKGCDAATVSNFIVITTGLISTPIITGKLKVCEGGKTSLVVTPTDKDRVYEWYRWVDIPIGDSISNAINFSAFAGQYQLLVKREGCVDSTLVTVTANDTEFPAGDLKVFPGTIPYGGRATFMADVSGADHFEWDLGDSRKAVTISNKIEQNYFTRDDSVLVKVRAVSERNCITELTAVVKVGKPDSVVLTDHSYAGNLKDWNVFPIPFHDQLKLSVILIRNETVRVDLFTAEGSWVRSWSLHGMKGENLFTLDKTETLSAGVMYFITAIYNNEKHSDKVYKY